MPKKIPPKGLNLNNLIKLYAGLRGSPYVTIQLLGYHLRQGNIEAKVWQTWVSDEPSLTKAWKNGPRPFDRPRPKSIGRGQAVKRSLWLKSVNWQRGLDRWDVKSGKCFITIREDPVSRIMLRGLRFNSGQASELFDPRTPKSRDDRQDAWREFWHEIIRLVQDGRSDLGLLEAQKYASSEALTSRMYEYLEVKNLSYEPSKDIKNRIPFKLSLNQIEEEVAALRIRFGLTKPRAD